MGFLDFVLIGISLSMDAFALSMCKGLSMQTIDYKQASVIGGFFGVFQFLMPLLGWALGIQFEKYVNAVGHWISFVLLAFIGGKMILDAFKEPDEASCSCGQKLDLKELCIMAVATSIDAFAVGVSFAFLSVNVLSASTIIGIVTFAISFAGVIVGCKIGNKLQKHATLLGGIVLVLIGVKIVLEHYQII